MKERTDAGSHGDAATSRSTLGHVGLSGGGCAWSGNAPDDGVIRIAAWSQETSPVHVDSCSRPEGDFWHKTLPGASHVQPSSSNCRA